MKAQAQAAPIIMNPENDPLPPVVIKIGGGSEPPNSVAIEIDSGLDWTGNTVPMWNQAWATFFGQIQGLTIKDPAGSSDPVVCTINPQIDALTTLTLYFASGQDTFEISEVPHKDGSIYVEAESSVSFRAMDPRDDRWSNSETTFPSAVVKVEFTQRRSGSDVDFMRFEYLINSNIVDLSLDFHKP